MVKKKLKPNAKISFTYEVKKKLERNTKISFTYEVKKPNAKISFTYEVNMEKEKLEPNAKISYKCIIQVVNEVKKRLNPDFWSWWLCNMFVSEESILIYRKHRDLR